MLMALCTLLAIHTSDLQVNAVASLTKKPSRFGSSIAQKERGSHPTIQESLNNGRFIRLSDNTLWEINPGDTPITQSWITPAEIISAPSNNSDYPFRLTNSLTGSSVLARPSTTVPKRAPQAKTPIIH